MKENKKKQSYFFHGSCSVQTDEQEIGFYFGPFYRTLRCFLVNSVKMTSTSPPGMQRHKVVTIKKKILIGNAYKLLPCATEFFFFSLVLSFTLFVGKLFSFLQRAGHDDTEENEGNLSR